MSSFLTAIEHELEPLVTSFTDKTFRYDQVERQGNIALFTQTHKESGIIRYEVVIIVNTPAHTFPNGITTPEHEAYPSPSQWGTRGWTMYTEAGAREKIRWLQHPSTEDRTDTVERKEWQRLHSERYIHDPRTNRLRERYT